MESEEVETVAEVKWIKICTDIFDDEKILLIESMPDSDAIIVVWFKLLCLAGRQNNGGVFMLNDRIAYTDEMLATILRRPLNTVRMALQAFESFGMVEIVNGAVTIPNWEKHQSIDKLEAIRKKNRQRVAKHRERQRLLTSGEDADGCNVTVTNCNAVDKNKNRDREEKKEKRDKEKPARHKYGEYQNVLLSDVDFIKLQSEFPRDWQQRIERLSAYMASTGKSYKNHLATIRNWARRDGAQPATQPEKASRPTVEEVMAEYGTDRAQAEAFIEAYYPDKEERG